MRYATINNWAKYFKEEGININGDSIRWRLKGAEVIGITARDATGKVLKNAFYSEPDVRSACAEILNSDLHQADENGFFVVQVADDRIRLAYRRKENARTIKDLDGQVRREWDNTWGWRHLFTRKTTGSGN